jgi:uncharacterized protein (DUF2147 family)
MAGTAWLSRGLVGMALLAAVAMARSASADDIVGTWLTDDGASKVEVKSAKAAGGGAVYNGTVVWLKEPLRDGKPLLDAHNSDATLRGRPILGLPILSGFKATATGLSGGTVYSPRAGKSFPAELSLAADGRLRLDVKAGILSKTDYWSR